MNVLMEDNKKICRYIDKALLVSCFFYIKNCLTLNQSKVTLVFIMGEQVGIVTIKPLIRTR